MKINLLFTKNKTKKSVSSLVVVILLVVVTLILVTILLNWGKGFVIQSLDKTANFQQEYTADTLTMFKQNKFTNSRLLVKNLKSNGAVTITGYKIFSESSHPLLNKVDILSEPVILKEGDSKFISMVQPPEKQFDVQLITDDGKYIVVKNVNNDSKKTFNKIIGYHDGLGTYINNNMCVQSVDGGYGILTGGKDDIIITKLNSSGVEEWTYNFNGVGDGGDYPTFLVATNDGGFAVLGSTYNGKDYDIVVIKLNSFGNKEWIQILNGPVNDNDYPTSLVVTNDGGFGILGRTYNGSDYDIIVVKLNSFGNKEWIYLLEDPMTDNATSLVFTNDGGFAVLGSTYNGKDYDIVVIKLNSFGNTEWIQILNGPANYNDYPTSLVFTNDGGFAVLGRTYNGKDYDIVVIKLDSFGNKEWIYIFNGPANDYDYPTSLVFTNDGGFGILGRTYNGKCNGEDYDMVVIKLDSFGNMKNTYIFEGVKKCGDYPTSLVVTNDGGFGVLGNSYNGSNYVVIFIKLTDTLIESYTKEIPGFLSRKPPQPYFISTSDGGYLMYILLFDEDYNKDYYVGVFKLNSIFESPDLDNFISK